MRLCSLLKSDPSRLDYIELKLSVAGLVDDMIEDSDPGAEHTLGRGIKSTTQCCRSIFGLYETDWGILFFQYCAKYVDRLWFYCRHRNISHM